MRTSKYEITRMMMYYLHCDKDSITGKEITKFVDEWKWVNEK